VFFFAAAHPINISAHRAVDMIKATMQHYRETGMPTPMGRGDTGLTATEPDPTG